MTFFAYRCMWGSRIQKSSKLHRKAGRKFFKFSFFGKKKKEAGRKIFTFWPWGGGERYMSLSRPKGHQPVYIAKELGLANFVPCGHCICLSHICLVLVLTWVMAEDTPDTCSPTSTHVCSSCCECCSLRFNCCI